MALKDTSTYNGLIGHFLHKKTRVRFSYAPRGDAFGVYEPELPHVVHVDGPAGQEFRLAIVKKTVAYVLTGDGLLERWPMVDHWVWGGDQLSKTELGFADMGRSLKVHSTLKRWPIIKRGSGPART